MKVYNISQLARLFGLSRSTLLYYDRIGLLAPSGRSAAGYRKYSEADYQRLYRICNLRRAGLSLEDIREIVNSSGAPPEALLEKRLHEITEEILALRGQQRLLSQMLKHMAVTGCPPTVDKTMWIEMMRTAGMDETGMDRWHAAFEARAPQAHQEFLLTLGISEEESREIRRASRNMGDNEEQEETKKPPA